MSLLKKRSIIAAAAMLAALAGGAGSAHAAHIPLNPNSDIRVNVTTTGDQRAPSVARNASGASVVVWQSDGQDGSGLGVYGQRYDASGAAVGTEFKVNTFTTGDQYDPSVAIDASGNFVVTWTSVGQDGSGLGVYSKRFNNAGVAQSGDQRAPDVAFRDQLSSAVAIDDAGNYVVTYTSNTQQASNFDVYARLFNAAGVAQSGDIRVNAPRATAQTAPAVARDANGFVVAWQSDGQDGSGLGVYTRAFNSAGAALSGEVQANNFTAGDQGAPDVALNNGDTFLIWESNGQDGSGYGIYGTTVAGGQNFGEFPVNITTAGDQRFPTISSNNSLGTVAAWQTPDSNGTGVVARTFTDNSNLREIPINRYQNSDQGLPDVALDGNGNYVIVWESNTQDGSGYGVYGGLLPLNNAPTTKNATEGLNEDMAFNGQLSARDEDRDQLFYSIVTGPTHGTVELNSQTGAYTYTPNDNYNGKDSFTFNVSDGTLTSNTSTVTLNIRGINDAPVAQNAAVTTSANQPVNISLQATDVDSGAFTFSIVNGPQNGTLVRIGDSTSKLFRYTPNAGFVGSDSFTFNANDGSLDSANPGTVTITVNGQEK